jgi:hypothetical protein
LISTGAETESARFRCAASRNRRHIFTMAGLLTLEDTVEFFNLVMELRLSAQEKRSGGILTRALMSALSTCSEGVRRNVRRLAPSH